jgi:hypothetical protein
MCLIKIQEINQGRKKIKESGHKPTLERDEGNS